MGRDAVGGKKFKRCQAVEYLVVRIVSVHGPGRDRRLHMKSHNGKVIFKTRKEQGGTKMDRT